MWTSPYFRRIPIWGIVIGVNTVKIVDNHVGNYGDIVVGLNFIDMGSGLSGFAKAQHRFDNEQETSSVQLGIRYKF